MFTFLYHVQCSADEMETNEKEVIQEEEVASGVTNINMEDETEGDKKKPRRRTKKKEIKDKVPESKEKKQTDPPSVPIHELFPTSTYFIISINKYYLFRAKSVLNFSICIYNIHKFNQK